MTNPILPNMNQFTNLPESHKAALDIMHAMNGLIEQVKPGVLPANLEGLLNNFRIAMQHAASQEIVAKHACFMAIQLLQEWFTGDEATDQKLESSIRLALQYAEDPALMQQTPAAPVAPPLVETPAPTPEISVDEIEEAIEAPAPTVTGEMPELNTNEPETELDRALMAMDDLVRMCDEQRPTDPDYLAENPEILETLQAIIAMSNRELTDLESVGHVIYEAMAFVQDWLPEEDNDGSVQDVIDAAAPYEVAPNVSGEEDIPTNAVPADAPTNEGGEVLAGDTPEVAEAPQEVPTVEEAPVQEDSFEALQEGAEAVKVPVFVEGEEGALPQIAIKTKALLQLINKVERGIVSKTVNDIEKFIYFEFTEDRAIARTYNSHFLLESSIPAVVGEEPNYQLVGESSIEVCFSGSAFIPLIKKLMTDDILITYNVEKKSAVIESDSAEFVVFTESGDQFPQPHRMTGDVSTITLPIDYLENMYQSTVYAVSEKNQRTSIMGLNHRITKEGIVLTAADGYRLSRQTMDISLDEEVNEEINCTIPKESIAEALRMMNSSGQDNVELRLTPQRMEYVLEDSILYGRLIEAEFPDVSKMINEDMEFYIDVPHRVLKEALTFTSMFESSDGKKMVFFINPSEDKHDGQLRIATPASEKGKYTQDAIVSGEGEAMTIQINFKYLSDALRKFPETSTIRVAYISHNAPLLVKDATMDKGNFDILLPIVSPESGMHAKINKFKVKNKFQAFKTSMFDGLE